MKITLPWPHKSLWPNRKHGRHWSVSQGAKSQAKDEAYICAKGAHMTWVMFGGKIKRPNAELNITFNPPDRRRRDLDNMLAACKAYLDGISDALGVDDSNFKLTIQKGEVVKGGQVVVEVS